MDFLDEKITRYAEEHTISESPLLSRINRETYSQLLMPRMLSGHLQGRILSTFARMINPSRILEIGTYTGYSALCLAEGLTKDGKLTTIEINEELKDRVDAYFSESPLGKQIDFRIGNAMEIVPNIPETFDLIFIDADKENYMNYYNMVFDKLRIGGFLIADNVLWSGKVLTNEKDPETNAIREFTNQISKDQRMHQVLFPVRDGLMVAQKLSK